MRVHTTQTAKEKERNREKERKFKGRGPHQYQSGSSRPSSRWIISSFCANCSASLHSVRRTLLTEGIDVNSTRIEEELC